MKIQNKKMSNEFERTCIKCDNSIKYGVDDDKYYNKWYFYCKSCERKIKKGEENE